MLVRTTTAKHPSVIANTEIQPSALLQDSQRREILRLMIMAREFDLSMIRLYRQGRAFGGVYSQIGNEATSVGSAFALGKNDGYFPMHRNVGGHFVRGASLRQVFINFLAREGSAMRGTDGTGHYADVEKKIFGNVSHLGSMIPVAAGYALAGKMRGEDIVAMTYIGDGGAQTGECHEGINFAAVQRIPLILIIENNQYAYSTPNSEEFACERLSDRAIGYGCFGETIDGTDVERVYTACYQAVQRGRAEGIPSIIETLTMRMRGHAEHDDASYVPKHLFEQWGAFDPVERYSSFLQERNVVSAQEYADIRGDIAEEMNRTIDEVVELPFPAAEEARKFVFVD